MAALRRARLEGPDLRAFPAFGRLGVAADATGQAVACFFALHPTHFDSNGRLNWGGSCRLLTVGRDGAKARFPRDNENHCSFDARFRRLLTSHDRGALVARVRQILPLLEHEGIAVDYVQLYREIRWWNDYADAIRRRWSVSYWGGHSETPGHETETEPQPAEAP
jgi:CRISPR type I-E-associated protein CasB/Cse2